MMKFCKHILIVILLMLVAGCSSNGTVNVGNPDSSSATIKIGKLSSSGNVELTIPEDLFGGADAIDSSTFLIELNSEGTGELDASDYYSASDDAVIYTVSGAEDGDTIIIIISSADSASTYSGAVSNSEETEASEVTSSIQGVFMVDETTDTCGHGSDRDDLCLQITEDGQVLALDTDDDNREVITDLSGRTLTFTYQEALDASIDLVCELTYSSDGETVNGPCLTDGALTCTMSFTKVSDDPFGFVLVDGGGHSCDGPERFDDAR